MSHRSRPQSAGPSRRERPTNSSPHAGWAKQRAHARPQSAAAGRRSPVQAKFTFSQWRRKNGLSPVRGRPGSAGPGGRGGGGRGRGRTDERGRAPGPGAGNEQWPPAKSYPRPASAPATRRPMMRGKALPVFSGARGTSTMPEDTPGYSRSSPGKTSPGKTRAGLVNMGPGRVKAMTLTSGTQGASKLDSYCRGSLNPFLHLLTDALLKERPHDVEAWALSFLQQRLATGVYQEPPRVEPAAQQQQAWGDARVEGEGGGGGGGGTDRSSVSLQATGADVSATSMMPPPPQREREREQEQGRGRGNQQADGGGAGSATGTRVSASLGLPPAPAKLPPFEWAEAGDIVGVGYEVQVNFNRKEGAKVVRNSHLYRGRVRHVNDDGTFEVKYHDGDEEDKVLPEWVKWRRNLAAELQATSGDGLAGKEFAVGDSVLAKCDGWTQAYSGTVTRVNKDGSLGIEFEDGEQRLSVPVSQVISKDGDDGKAPPPAAADEVVQEVAPPVATITRAPAAAPPAKLPPFEWAEAGDIVGVGYEVQVNFNRKEGAKVVRNSHLYRGRVRHVNDDGTFEVKYHDGDEEDKVLPEWVKWRRNLAAELQATSGDGLAGKEFAVGDSVLAKCDGWTQAYSGTVTRVNKDGSLGIEFEDGEQRLSVPVSQVTSKGGGEEEEEEEAAAPSAAPVQSNAEAADAGGVGSGAEATKGDEIATWQPRPIDTSAEAMRRRGLGEDLLAETFAAAELLAINVHEEWSLTHINQGYTYHPRRDDGAKRHPCLVPYNQLSEEDKEWDRVTSQETLKASMMLGYTITPIPGGRRAECVSVEALGRTLWSESGGSSAIAGDAEGKEQHTTQGGTYTPQVLPTRDEQLRPELLRLADDLAKNVHDSWASAKLGAGWKYAPAAEITDSAGQRLNALLKPYHLLGASDKVKNHHTAMATLRTMQYFGYSFVRSDPIRAGTRVMARAEGFKQHYAGTIHSISGGDDDSGTPFTYSVTFDDGDFREGLPLTAILIVAEDDGHGGDVGGGAQHGAQQQMGQGESVQQPPQQQPPPPQQQQQQEKEAAEIQAAAEQRRSSVIASADQKAQFVASQQKKNETKSGTSLDTRIPTSSPFGEHSTRNTHEAPRSSSTEDNPFPPVRADDSSESRDVERKALLNWIRKEVRRRAIGSSRLMGMMDVNKSNTVSLGEFIEGLAHVDIDLDRDEYMRVFKAIDVDGGNNLTIQEIERSLYSKKKGGTSVVHDRATFGTSMSHGKDNPFGEYGTRNTQIEMNSSITEENPFPEKVAGKKKGESDEIKAARKGERAALLVWLRKEIRRRKIGVSRLMQTMDANKSNTITLKEFSEGLATFDIDLDRAEYMRVFKAVDVDGGNQITRGELEETVYPKKGKNKNQSVEHKAFGTSTSHGKDNPFGEYGTRNSQIKLNSSITAENPFPAKVPGKKKGESDEIKAARKGERAALVGWVRKEIKRRKIGVSRLMQTMDANKSNTITLKEFSEGLATFDIDLDRAEYMRVFKAIDVDGGNQITRGELEETIYPNDRRTSIVHTKDAFSDSQNPFGHGATRNTQIEMNSSITEENPFPEKVPGKKKDEPDEVKEARKGEREALLIWLRREILGRKIGVPRLMQTMDANRSNTITLGEFSDGLARFDIDLDRDEYMRVFKAIDVDGGNQITRGELEETIYPHEKSTSIVHTKDDYSDSQNPFGHTSTRNTHKELNSSITADHPFPLLRASDSKEDRAEEREALLAWVRKELVQRAIGAPRLMGLCDSNRSNTITLGELTDGLAGVDIDLERDEYMRIFKAIDVDGGNQVSRDELEHVLYQ